MEKEKMRSEGNSLRSSMMKRMRLLSAAAVLLICCLVFVGAVGAADVTQENAVAQIGTDFYGTLADAVSAANFVSEGATIKLLKGITLGEMLTITGDVTIDGNDKTITRSDSNTGTLFTVSAGAKLTLNDNLTVDGNNNWIFNKQDFEKALLETTKHESGDFVEAESGKPLVNVPMFIVSGEMIITKTKIQNIFFDKSDNSNGGVFSVNSNAKLTLNDGVTITHCFAKGANAVAHVGKNASWTINDGTVISDNFAGKNGGICRNDYGHIVMNGGKIINNYAVNTNGVVFMMYGAESLFEMKGGEISGNKGTNGPANGRNAAIYLHSSSHVIMSGGSITQNTGTSYGGIDTNQINSKLEITGGYVGDNIGVLGNIKKDINMPANTEETENTIIRGGTFTQDISEWCGDGFVPVYDSSTGKFSVLSEDDPDATPAFTMTLVYADGNKGNPEPGVSLVKSIEWGEKQVVAPVQAMELDILTDWELSSVPPAITYPLILSTDSNTLTSKGGVFKVGRHDVEMENKEVISETWTSGNLTITDGTYIGGEKGLVVVTSGTLNITGGTFKASDESGALSLLRFADDASDAHIYITGGTFHNFNPTEFVPEGYKVVEIQTNVWTVKKIYTITVTSTEGGTASASAGTSVEGYEITLTVTPDEGYRLGGFETSEDIEISSDGKFTMPASDVSIKVVFEEIPADEAIITPSTSGGDGIGGALSFPRNTQNGGLVDFGSSKVIKGVLLPEGSSGSVLLKVDTIEKWPKAAETEYTFDISVEKLGEGMAYILFEIPESTLDRLGITPADIGVYHFVDGVWVKLAATYEVKEGTVFYEAATDSFSPFKLVIEEGAATPKAEENIPVIPPTEEPDVPDESEILPPSDEPTDEPETPAPILAVIAGLGAAVLLRRK